MTKSIAPSSLTQRSAAALRLSNCESLSVSPQYRWLVFTAMVTYVSDVNSPDADDLGTFADSSYLFGAGLCLFDIAPQDTSVCA